MRRFILLSAVSLVLASCACSTEKKGNNDETEMSDSLKTALKMEELKKAEPEFEIVTTHGTMKIKLYSKTPKHRDNFAKLVAEHYYDSIRFHRVIEGFMIQTGDPYSRDTAMIDKWGMGGPDYTVPAEFVPEYGHKKGALAAARKGDIANPRKSSSGSQFYIVHNEQVCRQLDGDYTVFGEVTEGLDVIDVIATVATDRYDRPYEDVQIISINPIGLPAEEMKADADSTVMTNDSTATE